MNTPDPLTPEKHSFVARDGRTHCRCGLADAHAYALEAALRAATPDPAEPLDLERLARALHVNIGDRNLYDDCPQTLSGWHRQTAETLAAAYARSEEPT